jgi:hypothetical protein
MPGDAGEAEIRDALKYLNMRDQYRKKRRMASSSITSWCMSRSRRHDPHHSAGWCCVDAGANDGYFTGFRHSLSATWAGRCV